MNGWLLFLSDGHADIFDLLAYELLTLTDVLLTLTGNHTFKGMI